MKKALILTGLLALAACTPAPDYSAMSKGDVVNYAEEQRKRADGNRIGGVLFGGMSCALAACAL